MTAEQRQAIETFVTLAAQEVSLARRRLDEVIYAAQRDVDGAQRLYEGGSAIGVGRSVGGSLVEAVVELRLRREHLARTTTLCRRVDVEIPKLAQDLLGEPMPS